MVARLSRWFLFLVLVPSILFSLRSYALPGGDSTWMVSLVTRPWYFFLRAPLVVTFHKIAWWVLGPVGWSPSDSIALVSALAGGVFLLGLYRFTRDPRVWGVVLLSKMTFVFLGHLENYAWPYALSLWVIVLLRESLEEGKPRWPIWTVLAIATFCHPMVLMLWPGVLWAILPMDRPKATEALVTTLVVAGLANLLMIFGKAGGLPQSQWVLPLFEVGDTLTRYPFFSLAHFRELTFFHLQTLTLGAILLARFGWTEWRGWKGGLTPTAAITLVWSLASGTRAWARTIGTCSPGPRYSSTSRGDCVGRKHTVGGSNQALNKGMSGNSFAGMRRPRFFPWFRE